MPYKAKDPIGYGTSKLVELKRLTDEEQVATERDRVKTQEKENKRFQKLIDDAENDHKSRVEKIDEKYKALLLTNKTKRDTSKQYYQFLIDKHTTVEKPSPSPTD